MPRIGGIDGLAHRMLRLAFVATAIVAMTYQFAVLNQRASFAPGNFFSFFTIQSNILGVVILSFAALVPQASRTRLFDALRSGVDSLSADHRRRLRASPRRPPGGVADDDPVGRLRRPQAHARGHRDRLARRPSAQSSATRRRVRMARVSARLVRLHAHPRGECRLVRTRTPSSASQRTATAASSSTGSRWQLRWDSAQSHSHRSEPGGRRRRLEERRDQA